MSRRAPHHTNLRPAHRFPFRHREHNMHNTLLPCRQRFLFLHLSTCMPFRKYPSVHPPTAFCRPISLRPARKSSAPSHRRPYSCRKHRQRLPARPYQSRSPLQRPARPILSTDLQALSVARWGQRCSGFPVRRKRRIRPTAS